MSVEDTETARMRQTKGTGGVCRRAGRYNGLDVAIDGLLWVTMGHYGILSTETSYFLLERVGGDAI